MSLVELLFFVIGIAISVLAGRCFCAKVGWWGIPLAPIVGFGSLYGLILLLDRIFPSRCAKGSKAMRNRGRGTQPLVRTSRSLGRNISVYNDACGFLKNLKLWLSPPKIADPDFGTMVFMHISKYPERSYWECEWRFPPTGNIAVITLRGDESGPQPEFRRFYLELPGRFNELLAACRPVLEEVYRNELQKALPTDIFTALKVAGFRVEDPNEPPVHWEVYFETTGDEYLGISIPFAGELALAPEVDIC